MKPLFKCSIITAVVSFLIFSIISGLGELTNSFSWLFNPMMIVNFILMLVIVFGAIVWFNKKYPKEAGAESGVTLGLIVFTAWFLVQYTGFARFNFVESLAGMAFIVLIYAIVLLVTGYVSKWNSQSDKPLHKQIWFWVVIGVVALFLVFVIFVSLTSFRYGQEPLIIQEIDLCEIDLDCGEGNVCLDSRCYLVQETTVEFDFEDMNNWYGDTEGCTENDTCWHIEYEGNNAVIEGWQHIWLYSSLDFSRIDSVSFLVKPNPFGDFDNNEWEFHFNYLDIEDDQENRYFLVMQYDQVGLQRQLGEVFEEYEYVDYTFTEEGNWYDVRIEFDDVLGTVVYIDDEMVLSDQTNKPEYEGATVSLETLDDSATWIDDLVIVGETYSQIYTL
jgi:hypothetical protein